MEKSSELETKYQKLAAEYSKVRSQATVLKKAVLDEQAKTTQLKEAIKVHEQRIRKHDQEMESLTFRNEQLTKRISFLQKELQTNSQTKKNKNRSSSENIVQLDATVVDEELQKKIIENAQLASSMADKDFELSDCKERIIWLETKLDTLEKELQANEVRFLQDLEKAKAKEKSSEISKKTDEADSLNNHVAANQSFQYQEVNNLRQEVERWKTECEFLRSRPVEANETLLDYYESQLRELLDAKILAGAETKSLSSENSALYQRLENLTLQNEEVELKSILSNEELTTTIENYKGQLDAMTEHLAAQNDKITKQCDEIEVLKHKLSTKK